MATNFPDSVDSFLVSTPTSPQNNPSHSAQHVNANDAIVAIETFLIDSSNYTLREIQVYDNPLDTPIDWYADDYPWLKALKVKALGGGGSGGGCATTGAGAAAASGGGGGGAYREVFMTDLSVLATRATGVNTIQVGSGGAAPTAGNNNGNAGSSSIFGSSTVSGNFVDVGGGGGGNASAGSTGNQISIGGPGGALAPSPIVAPNQIILSVTGGNGGSGVVVGGLSTGNINQNVGGGNFISPQTIQRTTSVSVNGLNANAPGAGGTGGRQAQNQATARTGGTGEKGFVILELYS
jgi:hypothetical protein